MGLEPVALETEGPVEIFVPVELVVVCPGIVGYVPEDTPGDQVGTPPEAAEF